MIIAKLHYDSRGRRKTFAIEECGGVYTVRRIDIPDGHAGSTDENALTATERYVLGSSSITVEAP